MAHVDHATRAPAAPPLPALGPMLADYLAADGQERADAAKHRAAILAAARQMMQGARVHDVTMKDIARRVGIGQGTLYRKFPTKAHLAGAILAEDLLALDAALVTRRARGADAAGLLSWFTGAIAAFAANKADLIATSMTKENMQPGWYQHIAPVQWLLQVMTVLFAAGRGAGEDEARQFAHMVLPQLLFPGDVGTPAARQAYLQRVSDLVDLLCTAAERRAGNQGSPGS